MTFWSHLHILIALLVLAAHGMYFIRALILRHRDQRPGPADRLSRTLSQWGLVFVPASSLLVVVMTERVPLSLIPGLAAPVLVLVFSVFRPLRKRHPWLLPSLVLLAFLSTAVLAVVSN